VRSLDTSPLIFCAGEIFHGGPNVHHAECNFPQRLLDSHSLGRLVDRLFRGARIQRHLRRYFSVFGAGKSAIGFKVMASQLRRYPTLLPMLVDLGATPLFLYRRDTFATALSYVRARASGVYHSDRGKASSGLAAFSVSPDDFRAVLYRCEADKREILALHASYGGLLLTYEDMISNWNSFISSIGDEIGIHGLQVDKALDRLSEKMPAVAIENEVELRRQFATPARA
jgi:hypothetical protein